MEIYRKLNWNKKLQGNTVLQRCGAHTLYYRFVPSKLKMQTNVPEHIFNKNGWSHRHDLHSHMQLQNKKLDQSLIIFAHHSCWGRI